MISAEQAVEIAVRDVKGEGATPTGVWQNDQGFVVGFASEKGYDDLTVFVDRHTGEADTLSATDYAKIMGTLRPVRTPTATG